MASKKQLEAAAATAGLFEQAPKRKVGRPRKDTTTNTPTAAGTTNAKTPERKRETATFSVKIDLEVLKRWRIYASSNGYGDKGKLTEAAIVEYMNRHKLTAEQQKRYDRLCDAEDITQ
jgi:hypothetical protein